MCVYVCVLSLHYKFLKIFFPFIESLLIDTVCCGCLFVPGSLAKLWSFFAHHVRACRFLLRLVSVPLFVSWAFTVKLWGNLLPVESLTDGLVRSFPGGVGGECALGSVSQASSLPPLGWFSAAPSIGPFAEVWVQQESRAPFFLFAWIVTRPVRSLPQGAVDSVLGIRFPPLSPPALAPGWQSQAITFPESVFKYVCKISMVI